MHKEQDQLCLIFDNEVFFTKTSYTFEFNFKKEFNQDFYIYLLKNKDELLRKPIFHRKCFINFTKQYDCRQAYVGVSIAKIFRKNHIKATRCIKYGQDKNYEQFANQNECLLSCYSKYKQNLTKELRKKCLDLCPLPDCEEVLHYIDSASDSQHLQSNLFAIDRQSLITEVIDVINFESFFNYIIGITSSLFGFNFLSQFLKIHSLFQKYLLQFLAKKRMKKNAFKYKKEINTFKKYNNYVRISFFIIANLICIFQLSKSVCNYFKFDWQHSFHYDFNVSMSGIGLTVSICFDLNDIFINDMKPKNLSEFTFGQISNLTLESNQLIESIILKTAVLNEDILRENTTSSWYLDKGTKCFDYDFKLQQMKLDFFLRISEMQVKTIKDFKHIFIRKGGSNPLIGQSKQLKMQLGLSAGKIQRYNMPFNRYCKNYKLKNDGCDCQFNCLEICQRNFFLNEHKGYLLFDSIVTKNDIKNKTISNSRYNLEYANYTEIKMFEAKCQKYHNLPDCKSIIYYHPDTNYGEERIVIGDSKEGSFQIFIQIETDNYDFKYTSTDLILSLINILSLWIGFQIPLFIDVLIKMACKFLGKNFFLLCFRYLFLTCSILMFLIHLKNFMNLINQDQKSISMHLLEAKSNYIPRFSLCFKFRNSGYFRNANINGLTPHEIIKKTNSIKELTKEIFFYDSDFKGILINKSNVSDYIYTGSDFKALKSKDFKSRNKTMIKKLFKIKPFLMQNSKCFEFIILFKYNIIDYRLKLNPHLFMMQPDFSNKSFDTMLILISNFERMSLENWHRWSKNDHLELSYKRLKIIYHDNLFYIKNPFELFRKKIELNQPAYFSFLHDKFFSKYNKTTTIIPLYEHKYYDTKIDNDLFKEFYLNFSEKEDYYLQKDYIRITKYYTSNLFVKVIKFIDKNRGQSILKLHPYFLKFNLIISNKRSIPDLILYATLILNLYLAAVFVDLPYFIQNSFRNLKCIQTSCFSYLKKFWSLLKKFKSI